MKPNLNQNELYRRNVWRETSVIRVDRNTEDIVWSVLDEDIRLDAEKVCSELLKYLKPMERGILFTIQKRIQLNHWNGFSKDYLHNKSWWFCFWIYCVILKQGRTCEQWWTVYWSSLSESRRGTNLQEIQNHQENERPHTTIVSGASIWWRWWGEVAVKWRGRKSARISSKQGFTSALFWTGIMPNSIGTLTLFQWFMLII